MDHDILTAEKLTEINNFWIDAPSKLAEHDEDVLKAVLDRISREVISASICFGFNLIGMKSHFDWSSSSWNGDTEGFPKLDGSVGITIISFDSIDLDEFQIDIEEVKQ